MPRHYPFDLPIRNHTDLQLIQTNEFVNGKVYLVGWKQRGIDFNQYCFYHKGIKIGEVIQANNHNFLYDGMWFARFMPTGNGATPFAITSNDLHSQLEWVWSCCFNHLTPI